MGVRDSLSYARAAQYELRRLVEDIEDDCIELSIRDHALLVIAQALTSLALATATEAGR